jgi:hypothetical protein
MKNKRFRYFFRILLGVAAAMALAENQPLPVLAASRSTQDVPEAADNLPAVPDKADGISQPAVGKPRAGYPLTPDNPMRVEWLLKRDWRWTEWFRQTYTPVYERLFADYGIDSDARVFLMEHIVAIYRAKMELRMVTAQRMDARSAYRERVSKILGDKYDNYREHEERWSVSEDLGFVVNFSGKSGEAGNLLASQAKPDGVQPPASGGPKDGYRLILDDPETARHLAERDRRSLATFRATHAPVYEKVLVEYGIDSETRESLYEHVVAIYRAELEVRKVTMQVMVAQRTYRDRMKKALGERYDDYLKYEDRWPVREESSFIAEFAGKSGALLSDERLNELQALIEKNETFTWKSVGSLGGPLGGVPELTDGTENEISLLEQRQASLALQSAATIQQAKASGFSPKELELLESYYRGQLQYYADAIEKSQPSSPKKIARLEQKLANLRQNPSANANEIRATAAMLDWMRSNPDFRAKD